MIRTAVLTAALLSAATAASAAERSFPVGGFDKIVVAGADDVAVTTGRAASVRASGRQDDLDRLDIRVDGRTLRIGHKPGWRWHGDKVRIAVTVPMVDAIESAGSADVAVDRISGRGFNGTVSGSGSLRLASVDVGTMALRVAGSGDVTASGRCTNADVRIAGSGNLDLAALKCNALTGSIAGSGNIKGFARSTATLSSMGSGDITVAGGARCTVSKSGSGTVRCTG